MNSASQSSALKFATARWEGEILIPDLRSFPIDVVWTNEIDEILDQRVMSLIAR